MATHTINSGIIKEVLNNHKLRNCIMAKGGIISPYSDDVYWNYYSPTYLKLSGFSDEMITKAQYARTVFESNKEAFEKILEEVKSTNIFDVQCAERKAGTRKRLQIPEFEKDFTDTSKTLLEKVLTNPYFQCGVYTVPGREKRKKITIVGIVEGMGCADRIVRILAYYGFGGSQYIFSDYYEGSATILKTMQYDAIVTALGFHSPYSTNGAVSKMLEVIRDEKVKQFAWSVPRHAIHEDTSAFVKKFPVIHKNAELLHPELLEGIDLNCNYK
jgi:hypothetical protein